ncbi:aldose 1-epimerase [Solirubrobacter soli]|uniref:aldose 1-epimerase n=1 Tax=Solirubrobacter soli TaxID=363832 RepID=UPI0004063274|nr:aldose 1-epimerase [Solirubrobacter soli]
MEVVLGSGSLEATIAPTAAMLVTSLRHHGEELLGQRADASTFVHAGKTTGSPLLYPWANRLSKARFELDGKAVDASAARQDGFGSPMHGLPEARHGWVVEEQRHDLVSATKTWDDPSFPFPHELRVEHHLTPDALTTTTEVYGDVPVAFGWHPFLQLPGEPREQWRVEIGAATTLELDDHMLPTGGRHPRERGATTLGDSAHDEALADVDGPFVLQGANRRITVTFLEGAPYAQFFAPLAEPLVAFEPMAAPGNALVTGDALERAPWRMRFRIQVTTP